MKLLDHSEIRAAKALFKIKRAASKNCNATDATVIHDDLMYQYKSNREELDDEYKMHFDVVCTFANEFYNMSYDQLIGYREGILKAITVGIDGVKSDQNLSKFRDFHQVHLSTILIELIDDFIKEPSSFTLEEMNFWIDGDIGKSFYHKLNEIEYKVFCLAIDPETLEFDIEYLQHLAEKEFDYPII